MRTMEEHGAAVRALIEPVLARLADEPEIVRIDTFAGADGAGRGPRVLARPLVAPVDLPPFRNSQMDGYAIRASEHGRSVRVAPPIAAGAVPTTLQPGTAAPIMTGAPMPEGADAVVPVEAIPPGAFPAGLELPDLIVPRVDPGAFVRERGSDLRAGARIAEAGAPVTPALVGLAAATGLTEIAVRRPLRVLVVSTGSELARREPDADAVDAGTAAAGADVPHLHGRDPHGSALPARIGDANGAALAAALTEVGVEAVRTTASDATEQFLSALASAAPGVDLVLTTGGISAGAFEVVRQTLEPRGLTVGSVALQPGGPQGLGIVDLGTATLPVLAFPGNPVSALVSFELFLRPMLTVAAGLPQRPVELLPAGEAATSPEDRHQIRRATVEDGRLRFVGGPGSHLLAHYVAATHLVHIPVGVERVAPGDELTTWRLR